MGRTGPPSDAKRPPRGVMIRKHKDVSSLQISFVFRGVRCRETLRLEPTAANLKYAAGLLAEITRKITHGSFQYAEYFPESPKAEIFGRRQIRTLTGERLKSFIANCVKQVNNGTMSPSTLNGYEKIVDGHLTPQWGATALKDIQPAALREWIAGLNVTAKTARNILSPLRSVFDDAVNDELLERSPLDKIALKKLLTKTTKKSTYEVDPFDELERTEILMACDGQARNLFQFAFWSGLRTSELIGLEWGDIDWLHGTVRVQRAVVVKKVKGTKTDAGNRDVMLLPAALSALQAQKSFTFFANERVFHNPHTNEPWENDKQIRVHCWQYILRKAKVRYRNPYQTRHTYASNLLSRGENPLWVATQMGHVDIEMITKHYGRWIPDKRQKYVPVHDWSEKKDTYKTLAHHE